MAAAEIEVRYGRRAFPKAQELLSGVPYEQVPARLETGWHDTKVSRERGAFAVVDDGDAHDLIGEIIRVTAGRRRIYVYVLGSAALPYALSLSRRAFLALDVLATESLRTRIERIA